MEDIRPKMHIMICGQRAVHHVGRQNRNARSEPTAGDQLRRHRIHGWFF